MEERRTHEAANGTINRELTVLGRMLRLAYENGKLVRMPVIRKLSEAPRRQGFFERERFEAARRRPTCRGSPGCGDGRPNLWLAASE